MEKKQNENKVYVKPEIKELGDASKLTKAATGPDADGTWGQLTTPVS